MVGDFFGDKDLASTFDAKSICLGDELKDLELGLAKGLTPLAFSGAEELLVGLV